MVRKGIASAILIPLVVLTVLLSLELAAQTAAQKAPSQAAGDPAVVMLPGTPLPAKHQDTPAKQSEPSPSQNSQSSERPNGDASETSRDDRRGSRLVDVVDPARSFSTPAKRLAGRWQDADLGMQGFECDFFGPANIATRIGVLVRYRIDGRDGSTNRILWKQFNFKYQVLSEDPLGERVTVKLLFTNGESRTESYYIEHDGSVRKSHSVIAGVELATREVYMDGKNLPCASR